MGVLVCMWVSALMCVCCVCARAWGGGGGVQFCLSVCVFVHARTSTVTSWNVRWTGYVTTLVIRWDSSDRSAMGHAVSTCTSSKYRKKSPTEVRRDKHRAQTFYENTRKSNAEHRVRQQNTETGQICELFHSPARSPTDDEYRRHADMGDSLTDEESQGSECGSCNADCRQ